MTGTAWILGAGFSKAISAQHMPTMHELGLATCSTIAADEDLVPLLSDAERAAIRGDTIPLGDLEVWLTSLASPQPFLNESENLRRAALSSQLTEIIATEVERRRSRACGGERPQWLDDLIALWHYGTDAVLSLNYDTLVENSVVSLRLSDRVGRQLLRSSPILGWYPMRVRSEGFKINGDEPVDTFDYFKLHGSTNWYVLPGGVDIVRADELMTEWTDDEREVPHFLRAPLRGATRAILIPTADKSSGYTKPVFANIWRAARARLEAATELVIFGYSLPPSDSSMRALLSQSVATDIPVTIIDLIPAPVRDGLRHLGLKAEGVDLTVGTSGFNDAMQRWASDRSQLVDWSVLDESVLPFYVCARDSSGVERPISEHTETDTDIHLVVAENPTPNTVNVSQDQIRPRRSARPWIAATHDAQPLTTLAVHVRPTAADIGTNVVIDVGGPYDLRSKDE